MGLIEQVTGVFTSITQWIAETIPTIESLFYNAETGLTYLGILSVCGISISIFLLLMSIIRSFLQFR